MTGHEVIMDLAMGGIFGYLLFLKGRIEEIKQKVYDLRGDVSLLYSMVEKSHSAMVEWGKDLKEFSDSHLARVMEDHQAKLDSIMNDKLLIIQGHAERIIQEHFMESTTMILHAVRMEREERDKRRLDQKKINSQRMKENRQDPEYMGKLSVGLKKRRRKRKAQA